MPRLLLAILALALLLRLIGLTWGLPGGVQQEVFHPDEAYALQCLDEMHPREGDFNPNGSHIEGAFHYYLVWLVARPAVRIVRMIRPLTLPEAKAVAIFSGRLLSVAFDLCSILLIYAIGRGITGDPTVGLIAALLLAVVPGEVIFSHYMRSHILANTWLLLAIFLAMKMLSGGLGRGGYALFGVVLGLGAATRYTMGILVLFLYVPALLSRFGKREAEGPRPADIALATVCALVAFFCGDPYLWLDWSNSRLDLEHQRRYANVGQFTAGGLLDLRNPLEYLTYLIPHAFTWPLAVMVYAAVLHRLLALRRDPAWRLNATMLLFAAVYLFFTSKGYSEPEFVRATLPLVPVGCLLLAQSLKSCAGWLSPGERRALWIAGGLLLALGPLRYSLGYDLMMTQEDTRLRARAWIDAHILPWKTIGLSTRPWFHTPPLGESRTWCLMPPDIEGLKSCTVPYWIVTEMEFNPEMLETVTRETPYKVLAEFRCTTAPLGVNLKEGKRLPLDYRYPCMDVIIFEWRPR